MAVTPVRRLAAAAFPLLLIAALYQRTAGHAFVFDDQMLVVDNPLVRLPLERAVEVMARSGAGISYRPVRVLSYQIDHAIAGGLDPAVFHASNVVWHAATTLAVLSLARATLASELGAVVAATLFAVHPLGSEAVAYVSGRRDLLCTLFTVLTVRFWWSFLVHAPPPGGGGRGGRLRRRGRRVAALIGVAISAALALGSKESAVVLPVLAGLLTVAYRRRQTSDARAGGARAGGAWSAVGLGLVAAAMAALAPLLYADRVSPIVARFEGPSLAPQPAFTLRVLGRYLLLTVWPVHLSAEYRGSFALPTSPLDGPSLVAALALAGLVGLGLALLARGFVAGAGLLWFVVSLLPVAQIVPYGEVLAEHNAYLALVGIALAAGEAVSIGARRRPRTVLAAAALVLALLTARTWVRVGDWRDSVTLWAATADVAPRSLRARYNLGVALLSRGKLLEAREAFERAIALDPDDRDVQLALGSTYGRLGQYGEAAGLARRALGERRDTAALGVLGWAQLGSGDAPAALASFDEAIALGDAGEDARRGRELARRRIGRF